MRGKSALVQFQSSGPVVLPSLLMCDFGNLEREIHRLEDAGIRGLHLDVMDGHFVPNLSYGMPIVAAVRRLTPLPLDVHLMISEPSKYATQFVDAGADCITIHAEVSEPLGVTLQSIRSRGVGAGIAVNPGTSLNNVEALLPVCDLVLIMSVNAGFGGQTFNRVALDKLRYLKSRVPANTLLEVDGGVNVSTVGSCCQAGADLLVVGSALFGHPDYRVALEDLKRASA